MSNTLLTRSSFFEDSDLTLEQTVRMVQRGLNGTDYGEFYQSKVTWESISKTNGVYQSVSVGGNGKGFGFRAGQGARTGYAYTNIFNKASLENAINVARNVLKGHSGKQELFFGRVNKTLYPAYNPAEVPEMQEKLKIIDEIEAYAYSLDKYIENVSVSYASACKDIHIITAGGQSLVDQTPVSNLEIEVSLKDASGKVETGKAILGGKVNCGEIFNENAYKQAAKDALSQAHTLLIAGDAPAGKMGLVLGPGWPSVLLHEAIGHGLEGDSNRRGISVYSGKIGEKIAAPGVTVIDNGCLKGERGSLHFDDEGTPTRKNILIEKGVLKGYMQDRQNAMIMGAALTGNGRRQSYEHAPIPRMTNTHFAAGKYEPEEIIASVKDGLYISDMGGGQVNTVSGQFNMRATLAYRIRNGKICEPLKGATLIGSGLEVIQSISMIGNDLEIEKSRGNCGKDGQSVMVGSGQPTIKVAHMTIGGTDTGPS